MDKYPSLKQCWFLVQSIKYMSMCDIIFESIYFYQFLSQLIPSNNNPNHKFYPIDDNSALANILDVCGVYFIVASATWNFIISLCLFRLLIFQTELQQLNSQIKWFHCYVWIMSLISNFAVFIYHITGMTSTKWKKSPIFALEFINFVPILFYLLFALILLLYIIYIQTFEHIIPNLSRRLAYFTIIFVINWIFISTQAAISLFESNHQIKAINVLGDMSRTSIGIQNAIIWATSHLLAKVNYLIEKNNDNDNDNENSKYKDTIHGSVNNDNYFDFNIDFNVDDIDIQDSQLLENTNIESTTNVESRNLIGKNDGDDGNDDNCDNGVVARDGDTYTTDDDHQEDHTIGGLDNSTLEDATLLRCERQTLSSDSGSVR